jgi:hypothetical protein
VLGKSSNALSTLVYSIAWHPVTWRALSISPSQVAREQAFRQMGGKGLEISSDSLLNATAAGSTETFALVRPSSTNAHRGVYMYLDEVGLLKQLPPNPRAAAVAQACGRAAHSSTFPAHLKHLLCIIVPIMIGGSGAAHCQGVRCP